MSRILRPKQQQALLGVSSSQLYRLGKTPDFPQQILLGINSTGRFENELISWLESRKGLKPEAMVPPTAKRGRPRKVRAEQGV